MEKSEVSDTDAPAIRQAIHGSSLRALLFGVAKRERARKREEEKEGEKERENSAGREIYAGSNIRLPGEQSLPRMPRMSFHGFEESAELLPLAARADLGKQTEIFRALYTRRRAACPETRVNPH